MHERFAANERHRLSEVGGHRLDRDVIEQSFVVVPKQLVRQQRQRPTLISSTSIRPCVRPRRRLSVRDVAAAAVKNHEFALYRA